MVKKGKREIKILRKNSPTNQKRTKKISFKNLIMTFSAIDNSEI